MGIWTCQKVHWIPRAVGIVLIFGVSLAFVIALIRHDVSPYVPFISETGAKPPESGIFSLFLDVTATIGLAAIVLRYMIVEECSEGTRWFMGILNKLALVIGIFSMLGMITVAAYPMTSIPVAHAAGAMILFLGSILYGLLHTAISYMMSPTYNSLCICRTRLMLSILSFTAFVAMSTTGGPARDAWGSSKHTHWTGSKTPEDEGFTLMLVSAVAEWTMSLVFIAYFFTFIKEFSKISVHINVHKLVQHFDDDVPDSVAISERDPLL